MPIQSDAVARECIADTKGCTLIDKCEECKIEANKLIFIDEMFAGYFKQLEYLKKRAQEKDVK
jgi:hypothetical protein